MSRSRPWSGFALICSGLLAALPVFAGSPELSSVDSANFAERVTLKTWLAYVVTGDAGVDSVSRAGLEGLARVLNRRTAVEAGGVAAVNIETDELAFFPLLYWAVSAAAPPLSEAARQRVNDYLRQGGTILYDTRNPGGGLYDTRNPGGGLYDTRNPGGGLYDTRNPGGGLYDTRNPGGGLYDTRKPGGGDSSAAAVLRALTEGIDIPELAPVSPDHVLTRSFYLLHEFPGRSDSGEVWVEAREDRRLDGVSPVVVGNNDWAGAWAIDPTTDTPLNTVSPGGERQREMAYRFGVNLVMYALTGNYKADQVHVPAILQRIGQ